MSLLYDLEDEVIADIARRVKKTGRYTETAELMAKSMVEEGYSAEQIRSKVMKMLRADKQLEMQIAENTKAHKQYVQDIINQTLKEAEEAGEMLMADAANMAWNNDLSMWEQHGVDLKKPNTMSQLMVAFRKQTNDMLRNLTRTTGFKDTNLGTVGILNAYQKEMDMALLKVATGTFSFDQAVNDCIHRLAKSGLRSIDYANGRTYQLDTAARMAVRTGMSQLSGKITEANLESTGHDLVITSQHMGSRPEHANWQNKVFSYSGKNKKYPDFKKSTGYGTVTGLKGANCSHDFFPYWEGASVIPKDLEYDEEYYKNTQKQRKMERDIRATKREIEAQKAIGGNTAELQSRLRRQTSDYRKFSDSVGLKTKDNRLRVKAGTSNINNTSVARRYKNDIIKKSQLNSNGDPMVEVFGAGEDSHPKEIMAFREELKNLGVELVERKRETLGYAPGLFKGAPGTAYISQGASYSAWCHEMKHVRDDYHDGWTGMRILEDLDKRYEREVAAYAIEIDMALKAGRKDIAERLKANLEAERRSIYGY